MSNSKAYILDLWKNKVITINTKQLDSDRTIVFNLKSDGKTVDLTGRTLKYYIKKSDGNVFNDCDIIDVVNGVFGCKLTEQCLTDKGNVKMEILSISSTGKESSFTINLNVSETIIDTDAVQSSSEYSAFVSSLSQVQNIDNRFTSVNSKVDTIIINAKYPPAPLVSAKGDGITDDTTAIQNIINSAVNGSRITFNGAFLISSSIHVSKPVELDFVGGTATDITQMPTGFLVKKAGMTTDGIIFDCSNARMRGGGVLYQNGATGNGIHVLANSIKFYDVAVIGLGKSINSGNGFRIGSDTTGNNSNSGIMIGCSAVGMSGIGLYMHDADTNANAWSIVNFQALRNGGGGIKLGLCQVNTIIGPLCEGNTGWGCDINPPQNTQCLHTFIGGDYEGNTLGQFHLASTAWVNYVQTRCSVVDEGVENTVISSDGNYFRHANINNLVVESLDTATPPAFQIKNKNPNTSNRNFAIMTSVNSYGDFGAYRSNTQGGDATTNGTPIFRIDLAAGGIFNGVGNPDASLGGNGAFYLKSDGTTGNLIWRKENGTWVPKL